MEKILSFLPFLRKFYPFPKEGEIGCLIFKDSIGSMKRSSKNEIIFDREEMMRAVGDFHTHPYNRAFKFSFEDIHSALYYNQKLIILGRWTRVKYAEITEVQFSAYQNDPSDETIEKIMKEINLNLQNLKI